MTTVYVLCFSYNLRHPQYKVTGPLTVKELSEVRLIWIRTSQQLEYSEEISNIHSNSPKHSLLVCQSPSFQITRTSYIVAGEFIILPSVNWPNFLIYSLQKKPFTKLFVYVKPESLHHTGVNVPITALRQMLWIPRIKVYVRNRPEYAAIFGLFIYVVISTRWKWYNAELQDLL